MSAIQQLLTDHIDIWTAADTGKKSSRGRASSNAASVYGVRKLRELILELAVRGKLVPQDPKDEPASELLKRIQTEKARLIVEGKIKKDKALPEIKPEGAPYQLPYGWKWVHFGSIAQHNSGKTLDNGRNTGTLHDYITTSNLYWGCFDLGNLRQMPIRDEEFEKCSARKGDLLICEGGEAGRAAVWFYEKEVCFQNHVHRARFYCEIDPYYAYRFFEKLNATGEINQHRKGVGISNMSGKALASINFPLPPIAEQHRIVAKVDELMALCDQLEDQHTNVAEAHEKLVSHLLGTLTLSQSAEDFSANWQRIAAYFDTLFTTEASIDALKQTLLQLAVMGKLVPQDASDEPASELLKRIQAEKAKLIAEGKIKKDKPLAVIAEEEKPFDLPQGWEWVRLGAALDITGGVTLGRKIVGADLVELPYLRVANVQRGHLVLDSIKTVEIRHSELSRYQLLQDDLLVTEGGDWDKVGRTAIWNSEIESCLHQNHIFRMRSLTKLSSSWIEMYMNSIAKAYFQAASKQTTNLASINMTQLKNCLLAAPALQEQYRIVVKVDELMALCDQLKSRITDANQCQKKLADVMVEQAVA